MPFDITKLDSQVIIFGGLTIGLIGMIWLVARVIKAYFEQSKLYYNHTNEVISRNTEAWIANTRSNERLVNAIEQYNAPAKKVVKKR